MTTILAGLIFLGGAILILVGLRCKHAWEFVDKTEYPAPIEVATKNGVRQIWMSDTPRMSQKTVVIVIRCPKCGACKVLRETH